MKRCIVLLAAVMATALGCSPKPQEGKTNSNSAPVNINIYNNGFENGGVGEWKPRGGAKIEASADVAHSGKYSLKISNRTVIFSAPEMDVTDLTASFGTYKIDCWVYVPKGSAVSSLQLTTEVAASGSKYWIQLNKPPLPVDQGSWVKMSGALTRKPGMDKTVIYVEPLDKTGDFYLDDVEITKIAL